MDGSTSEKRTKKLHPRVERLLSLILEAEQARRLREVIGVEDLDAEDLERMPPIEVTTAPAPERAVTR